MARSVISNETWNRVALVYRQDGSEAAEVTLKSLGYTRSRSAIQKAMERRNIKYEPTNPVTNSLGITRRCRNRDCIERFIPVNTQHWYHEPACAEASRKWRVEDILSEESGMLPESSHMELAKRFAGQKNQALRRNETLVAMREFMRVEMDDLIRQDPTVPFVEPLKPIPKRVKGKVSYVREPILVLSDFQLGKWANGIGVNHAERVRIPRILDATHGWIDQLRDGGRIVNKVHVVYGGDMLEGCFIYKGQNVTGLDRTGNTHRITRQIAKVAEVEARIDQSIAASVAEVDHRSVPGNHGRPNGKNDFADPEDNFDTLASTWAEDKLFIQTNINFFHEEHWWHGFESLGRYIVVMHGDKWKGSTLAQFRPILSGWITGGLFGRKPDVIITCHRHEFGVAEVNGVLVIQNGTIDGGSPWYTQAYGKSSRPVQTLLIMSEGHGVEGIHPIYFPEQPSPAFETPLETG
jgi:hypothetical protein